MAATGVPVRWADHIESRPDAAGGKPVVRGTRLSVDFILGLFAAGWTQEQVLENYPALTPEALRAVFAYAAEILHEEVSLPVRSTGA
jgi:uncharacterized protein (DUF433 family)